MQDPHIDFEAIVKAFREWSKRRLAIVNRNDGHAEIVCPFSGIGLMNEGRHANEPSTMNVKDNCFGCLFFAFEEFGDRPKEFIDVAYQRFSSFDLFLDAFTAAAAATL
jgi:hypothetical protein